MDVLEVRKIRLDLVFKLFYPFITVLGAVVVYFGKQPPNDFNYGNLLLLAVATFLTILLFVMIYYFFRELSFIKTNSDEVDENESDRVESSYDNIFRCFRHSGKFLLGYLFLFVVVMEFCPKGFAYIEPSKMQWAHSFGVALFLSLLPSDFCLVISGFKIKINTCHDVEGLAELGEKQIEFPVCFAKIKQFQWAPWSMFVFQWLYLAWFV